MLNVILRLMACFLTRVGPNIMNCYRNPMDLNKYWRKAVGHNYLSFKRLQNFNKTLFKKTWFK